MSKIIPINHPPEISIDHKFVHQCWILSYNAFWNNDRLPAAEVSYAKKEICSMLRTSSVDDAFIKFTERLLLSYKLVRSDNSRWIDLPSLWFNPQFPNGFSSQNITYTSLLAKRKDVKGYYKGINVFAVHFLRYVKDPSSKVLKSCYDRLLMLREYDLIQLWNNVIVHLLITQPKP